MKWSKHTIYWRGKSSIPTLHIRYEDMKKDAAGELAKITKFLGYSISKERLDGVVEAAKFNKMKKLFKAHNCKSKELGCNKKYEFREGYNSEPYEFYSKHEVVPMFIIMWRSMNMFGYDSPVKAE